MDASKIRPGKRAEQLGLFRNPDAVITLKPP